MDDIIDINTLFGPLPQASADLAVDSLLDLMQKNRVSKACTLSTLGVLLDPTIGNAATRAACGEHPELLPVATFNPTMFFGDTAPFGRLSTDGFRLVRLFPAEQGWEVDYAPLMELLRHLDASGLPLMVQIHKVGEITTLCRTLADFKGTVILAGVDHTTLAEAVYALGKFNGWVVETSKLLAPGCIGLLAEKCGSERVLFGSSAPAHPIASAFQVARYAGLETTRLRQILSGNARRILNIA